MVSTPSLEQITGIFNDGGIIATMIILGLWLLTSYLAQWIKAKASRPRDPSKPTTIDELMGHGLFQHCQYYVSFGVRKIKFSPDYPMRGKMYKDMLEIYFTVISETFKNNVARLATADDANWVNESMKVLRAAMDEYEYKFAEAGVPQLVIDKFADWHDPSVEFITNNINALNESKIAKDSTRKTSVLFGTILNSTKTAIFSAERTLIELNGELSGKTYKGEVIE